MITDEVLEVLACPSCGTGELGVGSSRQPSLDCQACGEIYPIVDGIADLVPRDRNHQPKEYQTDALLDAVAGIYDSIAPAMSLAVWRCSPLRFFDSQNRALGRANGGVFLDAPIGTGSILSKCLAPYHDLTVIGVDSSWNMLRKAQRRLSKVNHNVQLMRVDFAALPIQSNSVKSVQSMNGLHLFLDRRAAVAEFRRVMLPDGFMSGAALVRGNEPFADVLLDRMEHYGVFPMLRGSDYLLEEMRNSGFEDLVHSTHGAVVFFSAEEN